jgi:hypothetical protein
MRTLPLIAVSKAHEWLHCHERDQNASTRPRLIEVAVFEKVAASHVRGRRFLLCSDKASVRSVEIRLKKPGTRSAHLRIGALLDTSPITSNERIFTRKACNAPHQGPYV